MTKQTSAKRYRFLDFEFWAHYGKVVLLDLKDIENGVLEDDAKTFLSPADFLKRALAVRALIGDDYDRYGVGRQDCRRFLSQATECAYEAKKQGDISNPAILKEKLDASKPVKIFVPGRSEDDFSLETLKKINQDNTQTVASIMKAGFSGEGS